MQHHSPLHLEEGLEKLIDPTHHVFTVEPDGSVTLPNEKVSHAGEPFSFQRPYTASTALNTSQQHSPKKLADTSKGIGSSSLRRKHSVTALPPKPSDDSSTPHSHRHLIACAVHMQLEAAMFSVDAECGCVLLVNSDSFVSSAVSSERMEESSTGVPPKHAITPKKETHKETRLPSPETAVPEDVKAARQSSQSTGHVHHFVENPASAYFKQPVFSLVAAAVAQREEVRQQELMTVSHKKLANTKRTSSEPAPAHTSVLGAVLASKQHQASQRKTLRVIAHSGTFHHAFTNESMHLGVLQSGMVLNHISPRRPFVCLPIPSAGRSSQIVGLLLVANKGHFSSDRGESVKGGSGTMDGCCFSEHDEAVLHLQAKNLGYLMSQYMVDLIEQPFDIQQLQRTGPLFPQTSFLPTNIAILANESHGPKVFRTTGSAAALVRAGVLTDACELPELRHLTEIATYIHKTNTVVTEQRCVIEEIKRSEGIAAKRIQELQREWLASKALIGRLEVQLETMERAANTMKEQLGMLHSEQVTTAGIKETVQRQQQALEESIRDFLVHAKKPRTAAAEKVAVLERLSPKERPSSLHHVSLPVHRENSAKISPRKPAPPPVMQSGRNSNAGPARNVQSRENRSPSVNSLDF